MAKDEGRTDVREREGRCVCVHVCVKERKVGALAMRARAWVQKGQRE